MLKQNLKSKILVTGGIGYIGSHTIVKLIENGFDILVLDNLSNSNLESIDRITKLTKKKFQFEKGDIRDRSLLKKILKRNSFSAVIHFAGLKAVGESEQYPMKYYENNVLGSLILFEEMEKVGIKRIVFSSSATVYGEHSKNQYDENTPTEPINVYGKTKLIIENMLRDIKKSDKDWEIALLRYFNPIGAHPSGLIGENPSDIPNNLLPYIAQVAEGKREKLFVFGDDYQTPDGTGRRDYIHVQDLAEAHLKALNFLFKNKDKLLTLNLGTGKSSSVLEMIKAFEKASGKKIPYEIVDRRKGDIAECFADPSQANKILNWRAELDIDKMCEDAWRWQKNNKKI